MKESHSLAQSARPAGIRGDEQNRHGAGMTMTIVRYATTPVWQRSHSRPTSLKLLLLFMLSCFDPFRWPQSLLKSPARLFFISRLLSLFTKTTSPAGVGVALFLPQGSFRTLTSSPPRSLPSTHLIIKQRQRGRSHTSTHLFTVQGRCLGFFFLQNFSANRIISQTWITLPQQHLNSRIKSIILQGLHYCQEETEPARRIYLAACC